MAAIWGSLWELVGVFSVDGVARGRTKISPPADINKFDVVSNCLAE